MTKEPKSNCCNAPMTVKGDEGGTRYYMCLKCNIPCDPCKEEPKEFTRKETETPIAQCLCGTSCEEVKCKKHGVVHKNGGYPSCPVQPVEKEWEKEFDEKFNNNVVWWQECLAEMRIGDPDFKSLRDFISQVEQRALSTYKTKAIQHLKDCMGGADPTCTPEGYFDGFEDAINYLEKYNGK